jgi:hypothetical protein
LANAPKQFRPGNVSNGRPFSFFLLLGRKIKRVAEENVSLALIAMVGRDDRIERFGKSNLLH